MAACLTGKDPNLQEIWSWIDRQVTKTNTVESIRCNDHGIMGLWEHRQRVQNPSWVVRKVFVGEAKC